ncbi:MAG: exosortase-associated EpsI family protein [Planctomycetes bacterium]|nr:exosortase-associated EpsI family protein [Planctomycetota bacterium]
MRLLTSAAWLALFAGAGFTFLVERGYLGAAVAPDLALLPAHIGTLEVLEEIPLEPGSLGTQPPERYAFRRVLDARGAEGRLFVAYYARAQRWSGRPHDVEKCYAALGWQELEARRLVEAHRPWSRLFEREGETIRVVHWLERPGPDEDQLEWRQLGSRLSSLRGFRPDVASVYLEFPAAAAPSDAEAEQAADELSRALEQLW